MPLGFKSCLECSKIFDVSGKGRKFNMPHSASTLGYFSCISDDKYIKFLKIENDPLFATYHQNSEMMSL